MGHVMQHGCNSRRRAGTVVGLITIALFSSGCAFLMNDRIHYVAEPAAQSADRCDAGDTLEPAERILGVALSGGGSRASVFGASVLEALSEHGVLGQVSHVSSVSGGSLASSYFLANPPACDGASTQDAQQACWHDYFSTFKAHMRFDYRTRVILRNARPTRFSSPTRRITSLQEELDKRFLQDKTFGELGPTPVLLINATAYDETRRFVFSNACLPAGAADVSGSAGVEGEKRYRVMAEKALEQRALQAFSFSRPGCERPVPDDLPVSLAVAASAAFPPAFGPVSIQAPSTCDGGEPEWWHLGDGGAIENSGTDSLDEVLLRRLAGSGPPLKHALILSADAGKKLDPENLKSQKNFRMYSTPEKTNLVVISPRVRGQAWRDIFWDDMLQELAKEGIGYEKMTFRFSQAKLDNLPASCSDDLLDDTGIRELLLDISTDFKIDECNADLLDMAAHQLVHAALDEETVRRLTDDGFPAHTAQGCAVEY